MDGDIIGPVDLSLRADMKSAADQRNGTENETDQVAISMAEKMTGPSRMDESLIDFMTRPDSELMPDTGPKPKSGP